MSTAHFLGIDLGGTNIKALVMRPDGEVVHHGSAPTPRGGPAAVVPAMAALGRRLVGDLPLASVGVAVPGVVDMIGGLVKFLPNVPGDWLDRPVTRELSEAFGTPSFLINDARAAVYGELHFGAGRGCRHFTMLTLGTGIGGGSVVNGELLMGAAGHAGETGHTCIDLDGPRCACGGWGCAETLAAGPALANAARAAVGEGRASGLHAACNGDLDRITPRLVAETAAAGDPVAQGLMDEEARRVGIACSNLVLLLNPERVIIGGGVAQAGEPLLEGIRQTLRDRIGWYLDYAPVSVVAAELGEEAGALGAAAWARRRSAGG